MINAYYVLNILKALDGEYIEAYFETIDDFVDLDISNDDDCTIIVKEFLLPELEFFNKNQQILIQKSLLYCIYFYDDKKLNFLLNYMGGTIFYTPNPKTSIKQFYKTIYQKLFDKNIDFSFINKDDFYESFDDWSLISNF